MAREMRSVKRSLDAPEVTRLEFRDT